jgi:hypothetical protein
LPEIVSALVAFVLLCASAGIGIIVGRHLPDRHRTRETIELMHLAIGLLAAFAAIVLGLLTASVKQNYDNAALDRQRYALQLNSLDLCLRDYGPDAASARADLHSYTAAVIASTWPTEPLPVGVSYPDTSHMPRIGPSPVLAHIMDKVGLEISRLTPTDSQHEKIAAFCRVRYEEVLHDRLSVIEDTRTHLSQPFYRLLVFWLMIMFGCFGLLAPRNTLSLVIIALCAVSLSSVMFVIVDLSRPYGGFFSIPSTAMRDALNSMLNTTP